MSFGSIDHSFIGNKRAVLLAPKSNRHDPGHLKTHQAEEIAEKDSLSSEEINDMNDAARVDQHPAYDPGI